jgi:hypothetical protein
MGNFLKKKHFAYAQLTGSQQPAYWTMSVNSLQTVLDAIFGLPGCKGYRIYFGYATPGTVANSLPGFDGQMLLIFTGTDKNQQDLYLNDYNTPFYVVAPPVFRGNGAMTFGNVVEIHYPEALPLVMGFYQTVLPLSRAAMNAVSDKYGQPSNAKETTSFTYDLGWRASIYDDINLHGVKAVSFYLGSYSDDCNEADVPLNQNTMVFEYADTFVHDGNTYYYHFDVENLPGTPKPAPGGVKGSNTINPCPPNICSGTSFNEPQA